MAHKPVPPTAGGDTQCRRRLPLAVTFTAVVLALAGVQGLHAAPAGAATFPVNSTADVADMNPGDGVCSTGEFAGNKCTLRAAILEANAHPGADTIEFTLPGPFQLGMPTVNDDTPTTGDFDIMAPLTIRGNILI